MLPILQVNVMNSNCHQSIPVKDHQITFQERPLEDGEVLNML